MNINEATITRIRTLSKAQRLSMYELAYKTGMPPSTVKSIMNGKSKNPGIVNIKKMAEGLGLTIREFYDDDIFDNLEQDE
ncbi:MAG: helix-turn-helix transcriptional regulator [Lachnospiraceae bacterium]|jgi:transcriptional regulator with XRE-family HTH domain|nr:helix-turn-helix transcriptional regulator [Lachnospiraceae bacterium]MCI9102618.1 helix-turn-helix transcriptional regulator [Lachnospiraceae bacterium]MCI9594929.1 helix-turn-helix transcriptional regulator [Lachnospiraceae bacterium]MDO4329803.1 helix-turn-helix transcriptional regulator [Lachnospiraceae bacterium]MDO5350327.1 helix-turn-helix transcriptional regulator [Lachnospiraceae bacterium]